MLGEKTDASAADQGANDELDDLLGDLDSPHADADLTLWWG